MACDSQRVGVGAGGAIAGHLAVLRGGVCVEAREVGQVDPLGRRPLDALHHGAGVVEAGIVRTAVGVHGEEEQGVALGGLHCRARQNRARQGQGDGGWNRSPRGDRYLPTVAGTLWMVPSWRPCGCIHACGELPTQPMEHARQSPPVSFFSVAGAVPARYPLAQSDQESSLGVSSLAVGNTVSPPSVTLLRYMSTVA